MTFRPALKTALAPLALTTVLAACGGGGDDTPPAAGGTLPEAAATFAGSWLSTACAADNTKSQLTVTKTADNQVRVSRGTASFGAAGCAGPITSSSPEPNPPTVQLTGLLDVDGVKFSRGTNAGAAEVWGFEAARGLLCRLTGGDAGSQAADGAVANQLKAKGNAGQCFARLQDGTTTPPVVPVVPVNPPAGNVDASTYAGLYWGLANLPLVCSSTQGGRVLQTSQSSRGVNGYYVGAAPNILRKRSQWYEYTGAACDVGASLQDIQGIPVGDYDMVKTLQPAQSIGGRTIQKYTAVAQYLLGPFYMAGYVFKEGNLLCDAEGLTSTPMTTADWMSKPQAAPTDDQVAESLQRVLANPAAFCFAPVLSPYQR